MKKMYVVSILTMVFGFAQAEKIKVGDYSFKAEKMPVIKIHDSGHEEVAYIEQLVVSYSDIDMEDSVSIFSLNDFQTAIETSITSYKRGKAHEIQKDIYINGTLCKSIAIRRGIFRKNKSRSSCKFSYEKAVVEYLDEYGAKILKIRHRYYLNL